MTSKERLLMAFRRQVPDHVPVCPDISVMVPAKLSGRPFYELFLDGREHHGWTSATYAETYVQAVKYFGIDGWYIYGGLKEIRPPDAPTFVERVEEIPDGRMVTRVCHTRSGDLREVEVFPADQPPWKAEKLVKNLREDFVRLKAWMGPGPWQWESEFRDRERIGEHGVYAGMVPLFQDWWFANRQGGFEQCHRDFYDEEAFMGQVREFWLEWALAYVRAMVAAGPDEIMLGGSSASLSISSPSLFLKYELPFVKEAARICRQAGIVSHLHVCGRSWKLLEIVAAQTDVDVMEPLEEPPGGDVDLAEAKRLFGQKLCLKGNINTYEFLLNATPAEVEVKCKRCIDAAAAGGGYVLSTGDQCARDTPHANIFKMVEVAKTYGRY